jgi:hypothetical protein
MTDDNDGRPPPDALADFHAILTLASTPVKTAPELAGMLRQIYDIAARADLSHYDIEAIRRSAADLFRGTGHLRLSLRDQIPDWQQRGLMTEDVQNALRDVFRITRYAADMLGELSLGFERAPAGDKAYPIFEGPASSTLFHSAQGSMPKVTFRSGDVLVVRGTANNSAAIARIGDIDSQFSHVCIVHIDGAGKGWVVEALIEAGAVVNTLEQALNHGCARAALFRHKDSELASRASAYIFRHVKNSRLRRSRHIPYDFSMRLDRYSRLFCSKLVRQAYEAGSDGRVKLPTYLTSFSQADPEFLGRIGVKVKNTFAPGDMELESDFALVAEWADHRMTSDVRLQDMVLTEMFEWMEKDGWRFKQDNLIRLIGWFGRFAAHLSEGVKDTLASVVPKVPLNMRRRTIATIAMLHKTAQPLVEQMRQLERETIERTGHPMHGRDILAHLERIKAQSGGQIGYLVAPSRPKG